MSKKSKKGKSRSLSPAAYIRTRARSLPIYKCMVNKNWDKEDLIHAVLSRQHSNGNVTICVYLLDLLSQGVTDSIYFFNEPRDHFEEILSSIEKNHNIEFKEVEYALVHNIVYAAVEYAEDLGFMPPKAFSATTRFMLEEDTDEVELIDIECGIDGMPAYMPRDDETPVQAQAIIKKLEKAVGPGNFIIIGDDRINDGNDFGHDYFGDETFDDEGFDDEDFDEEDFDDEYLGDRGAAVKYDDKSLEEKKALFKELYPAFLEDEPEAMREMLFLAHSISNDLPNEEDVSRYYEKLYRRAGIDETTEIDEIPDELWGINSGTLTNKERLTEVFLDVSELTFENAKVAHKMLRKYKREFSDIPFYAVLELTITFFMEGSKHSRLLKKYHEMYPQHSLINLLWQLEIFMGEDAQDQKLCSIDEFFPGRESILHPLEFFFFLEFELAGTLKSGDITRYETFYRFVLDSAHLLTQDQFEKVIMTIEIGKASLALSMMAKELNLPEA